MSKYKLIISIFCFFSVIFVGCTSSSQSWAYQFVKWNDQIYIVTSDEIKMDDIGKEIGEVTKYSDKEGTYSGNFSNTFKEETKYYEIKNIKTDEAIAVEKEKGVFIKAEKQDAVKK